MWKLNESYVVLKQVHVQRKENEMCKVKAPVQGSCIILQFIVMDCQGRYTEATSPHKLWSCLGDVP
jgi:hypothetical protein